MTDYHILTVSKMCAAGQRLRGQALLTAVRIESGAWQRAAPSERQEMLDCAYEMSNDYAQAFQEWREHRAECQQCQEATQP